MTPDLFEQALSVSAAGQWPFDLARIQLAFGEQLHRTRATTRAPQQLSAAAISSGSSTPDPGCTGPATSCGPPVSRRPPDHVGPASLTPQQREIAQLAGAGLTNKQIGERLFLSHRTVGTHLHQLFPKLGITSRAALRDALKDLPTEESPTRPRRRPRPG